MPTTCWSCGLPVEDHDYEELKDCMAVPLDPALMTERVEPPCMN
jgi:hypothetical protein